MPGRTVAISIGIVIVVAGAFFFLTRGGASTYEDVEGVIAALESEGIECNDPPEAGLPLLPGGEAAFCELEGETVAIAVYDDEDALNVGLDTYPPDSILVVGPNWLLNPESEALAESIAEALDGVIRTR